jgi:hypothetical protein
MFKFTIYLKSGQHLNFVVEEMTIIRDELTKAFLSLRWKNDSRFYPRLNYIRVDDISAIVLVGKIASNSVQEVGETHETNTSESSAAESGLL